jgi:hypothetical protein
MDTLLAACPKAWPARPVLPRASAKTARAMTRYGATIEEPTAAEPRAIRQPLVPLGAVLQRLEKRMARCQEGL